VLEAFSATVGVIPVIVSFSVVDVPLVVEAFSVVIEVTSAVGAFQWKFVLLLLLGHFQW